MDKIIQESEAKVLMLDLLHKFSVYCEKNHLRYYLAAGTLLGAIRHQGYIPWDNDIDVWMPRPDYERFLKNIKTDKVDSYIEYLHYQEIRTFPFAKLIDGRTILKEHFLVTEDSLGIYIDIFPLDGLPTETHKRTRIERQAVIYKKLYAFANYRFGTGATLMKKTVKVLLYPFSRLVSNEWVCRRLNHLCEGYDYDECQWVGTVVWGPGEKDFFQKEWFAAGKAMFEGHEFTIPGGYDALLKKKYGDYMALPPEGERSVHFYEARWK